jgi:hypothetical protein
MSTILQTFVYPRPGKLPHFMKNVACGTKIVHRDGGKVRLWNTASGGEPGTIVLGIENSNFKPSGSTPQSSRPIRSGVRLWQSLKVSVNQPLTWSVPRCTWSSRSPSQECVVRRIAPLPIGSGPISAIRRVRQVGRGNERA